MEIFKWFISWIAIITIAYIAIIGGLNYSGYCFSDNKYLSDEKKINIVVKHILAIDAANFEYLQIVRTFDKNDGRRLQIEKYLQGEPDPYRDINEFFALNPNCCIVSTELTIEGGITHISRWSRLINNISSVVTIKYLERHRDSKGMIYTKTVTHNSLVTNCGDVVEDDLWSYFE